MNGPSRSQGIYSYLVDWLIKRRSCIEQPQSGTSHVSRLGPVSERKEVNSCTSAMARVHRGGSQLHAGKGIPPGVLLLRHVRCNLLCEGSSAHHRPHLPKVVRSYLSLHQHGLPCLAPSLPAAGMVGISLHPQQAQPGPGNQGARPCLGIPGMVTGPRISLAGSSLHSSGPVIDSGVRCLRHKLGEPTWEGSVHKAAGRGSTALSTYVSGSLRAVRLAFQAFWSQLQGKVVQVLMDNTSIMFYIKEEPGNKPFAGKPSSSVTFVCSMSFILWQRTFLGPGTFWQITSAEPSHLATSGLSTPMWLTKSSGSGGLPR
ncbi:uncharacterized protein LOC122455644 [Dermochelys coriacea]|uniref:uncharacterized protein LOC122455644 n=1 Tax=Dermochelys coriacea TaxID=27794 RepID=UPI001CA86000|nr:uncharacterized protein LOC122455644 [Dermochelys coriacea]